MDTTLKVDRLQYLVHAPGWETYQIAELTPYDGDLTAVPAHTRGLAMALVEPGIDIWASVDQIREVLADRKRCMRTKFWIPGYDYSHTIHAITPAVAAAVCAISAENFRRREERLANRMESDAGDRLWNPSIMEDMAWAWNGEDWEE